MFPTDDPTKLPQITIGFLGMWNLLNTPVYIYLPSSV